MKGKKATNKIVDIILTTIVISLVVGLVTLEVKSYNSKNNVTTSGYIASTSQLNDKNKVKSNSKNQTGKNKTSINQISKSNTTKTQTDAQVNTKASTQTNAQANTQTSAQANTQTSTQVNTQTNTAQASNTTQQQSNQIAVTKLDGIYYAKQLVNVRAENNTNSNVLTTLTTNQAIQVTGQTADGWIQVNWYGSTGYVKAEYLSDSQMTIPTQPTQQSQSVQTPQSTSQQSSGQSGQAVQEAPQAVTPEPAAPTQIGRVHINGNISVDRATYLNNACSYIPSTVLNAFDALGFKIEIGNYGQSWAGLFNSGTGYIYIENNTSMDLAYVLSHEMGHFLDLLTFNKSESCISSKTSEFTSIFNEERLNLSPRYSSNYNYYVSDQTEYFAECFSQYILDPGTISSRNPKTYQYVNDRFNSISDSQVNWVRRCLGR